MSRTSPRLVAFLAMLTAVACGGDDTKPSSDDQPQNQEPRHPVVVEPSADAIAAAAELQLAIPGAVVEFSPQTGGIARVDGPGLSGLDPDAPMDAAPLVEGRGNDEDGEHSALMEYMLRYGGLYGLDNPADQLAIPRDLVNDDQLLAQEQFSNGDLTNIGAFRARRFVQVHAGVPITGRDIIGFFDGHGGLQSVATRIARFDAAFSVTPGFVDPWARIDRPAIIAANPSLAWLDSDIVVEHAEELAIEMVSAEGDIGSEHPDATPRLAYRLAIRASGLQALVLIDATTGALIHAIDVMPSDWASEGVGVVAGAPDELGNLNIFLATDFGDDHYMAISANGGIPAWLEPGSGVSVSDTTGRKDLTLTYYDPLKIPKVVGGVDNNWNTDTSYTGGKRQAGKFISTITTTFDYWYNRRSWRSWDGLGSTFWASFFNHKSGTTPELNAWGSNGIYQVGDGTTSTGQYLGSSLEVSGHELTHNVISATTQLVYQNESGAVNEALADLFGVAMTANRTTDAYSSDYIGDDVGWLLRNMRDPTITSQPGRYSDYVVTTGDSGGVHTNSGIINHGHTLMVNGGVFDLIAVPRIGLSRVEQITWAAMRFKAYGTSATMNEFANGTMAMCSITDGFNRLFGDTSYARTCAGMRKGFIAVGVLPRPPFDFKLEATAQVGTKVAGLFGAKSGMTVAGKAKFVFTDGAGNKVESPASSYLSTDDRTAVLQAGAGDRIIVGGDLPTSILTPSGPKRRFDIQLVVEGSDVVSAIPFVVTSDLVPSSFTLTVKDGGFDAHGDVRNERGTGFIAGLTGAVLGRVNGHGPFEVFDGLTGTYSLAAAQSGAGPARVLELTTTGSGTYNLANGAQAFSVPTATEIPGHPGHFQVWYDVNGGLDAIDDHLQVYVFVDATDLVDESDETNNLYCVNCHAPGQAQDVNGVVVRFPKGTSTDLLFPVAMRAAAAKLPATYDRLIAVPQLVRARLPYKVTP